MGDAEKKMRLVGLAEAIAECDAAQALFLFQWATRLERASADLATSPENGWTREQWDEMKASREAGWREVHAVARELRETGEGLRGHAAATLDRLKLKARDVSPVVR